MEELKVGDCVEILNGKYRGNYGRVHEMLEDGSIDVELDYSYIMNVPAENIRKDR